MKFYTFYSPSHRIFAEKWLLPTLQDDYRINITQIPQDCPSATFMEEGFLATMLRKLEIIIRATKENWGEVFIFSDPDIQFFKPTEKILRRCIRRCDLAIQRDCIDGEMNTGFFISRGNEKTLRLWETIQTWMQAPGNTVHEQGWLKFILLYGPNECFPDPSRVPFWKKFIVKLMTQNSLWAMLSFFSRPWGLRWRYLPDSFFCPGARKGKHWFPGMPMEVPKDIVMHHANWTPGVENKLAQLELVRKIVEKQK